MKQQIRTITLLLSLALSVGQDSPVTCIVNQDCVLPCSSSLKDTIHWYKDSNVVHTYYKKEDHLEYQDANFRGRTALFLEQLPKGNISVLLKQVKVKDSGRYKCYTADNFSNRETFVVLSVKAPIKWVDIKKTEDRITCSTRGVYPAPNISWYINLIPQQSFTTETLTDEEGLYKLNSNFTPQQVEINITYSCSISVQDQNQIFTASLREEKTEIQAREDAVIHCPVSQSDTENYIITLNFADSITILTFKTQAPQTPHTTTNWKDIEVQPTHEGTITLHKLEAEKHNGTYTCEKTTDHSRVVVQTRVQIKPEKHNHLVTAVVAGAGAAGLALVLIILITFCYRKQKKTRVLVPSREC